MTLSDKEKLSRARRALEWVKDILNKRRGRVRKCHRMKVEAYTKAHRLHEAGSHVKAQEQAKRGAYWREQEDKAILGRREFNLRRKRIERKIKVLEAKVERDNALPASGVSVPDRPWNPYKRPIANWIIPWLDRIWANGCRFAVVSGFRSDAYQCQVCERMCPGGCRYGCPGRCARPGTSNHRGDSYPEGAVDVTNYYAVEAALARIGSPLHNSLGAQDPVHMSASGY